jgi:hypothetical protein
MHKLTFFFIVCVLLYGTAAPAQDKFYTKTGKIFFKCTKSPLEKIEATNRSTTCVMDTKTGMIQFAVLMKGFEFEKALMQEHFNENYVETDKFPRAEFKGQVVNNSEINYAKDGSYIAHVKGALQIHGETKTVETNGTLTVKGNDILINSTFTILLSDYKVEIPSVVSDKISNTVNITVEGVLEPLHK